MQGTLNQTKSSSDSIMPFSKDSSNNNENSGLHDLQAMASSAKRRRSQRLSTQIEAQDSLLRSTAALDAVVLPDPNKEQEVAIDAVAPVSAAATPAATGATKTKAAAASTTTSAGAVAAATEIDTSISRSSGKSGIYIGLVVVAAAAAAAFFVMKGKSDAPSEPAAKPVAAAIPAIDPVPADAAPEEVEPEAVAALVAGETEGVDGAKEETEPAAEPAPEAPKTAVKNPSLKSETAPAKSETSTKAPKVAKTSKGKAPKESTTESKTPPKAPKETKTVKVAKKPDANASLDDVLSTVTGGIDQPIAKSAESDKPSKKTLSRGDVAKAMKKITPAAKGCYKAEEFSGMVKIKYSVGPDGKVTKASAGGAHASSKTGACVVKAVKKAKFPPFSGATMSFTFPFLLSP